MILLSFNPNKLKEYFVKEIALGDSSSHQIPKFNLAEKANSKGQISKIYKYLYYVRI